MAKPSTFIALLRGINVGGRNKLPMADLRDLVAGLGFDDVRTCIQSGNVVFRGFGERRDRLAGSIAGAIEAAQGFRPGVLVLTSEELHAAIEANPYTEADADPKSVHLFFLEARPSEPDLEAAARLATTEESFSLADRVFYLHAPGGIGRSRLAARAERILGVRATARNWRTVLALARLAA